MIKITSQNNAKSITADEVEVATVTYTTDSKGGMALTFNITDSEKFHASEEAAKDVATVLADAIAVSKENTPEPADDAE